MLEVLKLINLGYIALLVPLQIGFQIPMLGPVMGAELISLVFSVILLIVRIRTPVINKGTLTLKTREVLKDYWRNGLLVDVLGAMPFNLLIGLTTIGGTTN